MNGPQVTWLPDRKRLHLHHGPIDLIIEAQGPDARIAYENAAARFDGLLEGLVQDLRQLRAPVMRGQVFQSETAQIMCATVLEHSGFVTPMACVAGAVADTVLAAMLDGTTLTKAYVNNGGTSHFTLPRVESVSALGLSGPIAIGHEDTARGLATSGWRGRSQSLGIADAVTVAAKTAAQADVAATLIANAVDLPDHPQIKRMPANEIDPSCDLGSRLVTTEVGALKPDEVALALSRGMKRADKMRERGLIQSASLTLNEQICVSPTQNDAFNRSKDMINYA